MEIKGGNKNKTIVMIYEALGTGILLYAINMTAEQPLGKFGVSFTIFALVLIGGPITGAHFNPAVTLGVYISNLHWKEDWHMCLLMMVSQFFGGIWGVCLAWCSLYNPKGENVTRAQVPRKEVVLLYPGTQVSIFDAFQIEVMCTCIFVMVCLLVKTGKTKPTKQGLLSALAVASVLLGLIIIMGNKSGAALNPAVGLA